MQHDRLYSSVLFYTALALTIVELIVIQLLPDRFLLERVFADDYFYYLELGRNAQSGIGPSFDGLKLTNGFHPLYLTLIALLTPFTMLEDWSVARLVVGIPIFAHNLSGVAVALIFRRLDLQGWSTVFVLIWWFNPFAFQIAALGLESPLATLFLAVFILVLVRDPVRLPITIFLSGIAAGFAILARTDSIFVIPAFCAWLCFVRREGRWGNSFFQSLLFILTVAVFTSPWWIWNIEHFGTIMQSSGEATRLHSALNGSGNLLGDIVFCTFRFWFRVCLATVIVFLGLGLACSRHFRGLQPSRESVKSIGAIVLFFLLLSIYYTVVARHVQGWYLHSSVLAGISGAVYGLSQIVPRPQVVRAVALPAFLSICVMIVTEMGRGPNLQWGGYLLARWLNNTVPETVIVGAWNSGIIGFFSGHRVVNLDGVVNNEVVALMKRPGYRGLASLRPYLDETRIGILADYEPILPQDLSGLGFESEILEGEGFRTRIFRREVSR